MERANEANADLKGWLDRKLSERDAALDKKLTDMRNDIVAQTSGMLEARTAEILEVIHGSEARTRSQIDLLSEGLHSRITLVAEGYAALVERQDRTETRLITRIDAVERDLSAAIRALHARPGRRNRKRTPS